MNQFWREASAGLRVLLRPPQSWKPWLAVAGVVLAVSGIALWLGHGTPPTTVGMVADMPAQQAVGQMVTLTVTADSQHSVTGAVLDLGGCADHWVIVNVKGASQVDGMHYTVPDTVNAPTVSVALTPKDAGNHTCSVSLADSAGGPLSSTDVEAAISP